MNFELKEYYKLGNNVTNYELITEHLKRSLESIKWINTNINELMKEEVTYPEYNWEFSKELQVLTIASCVLIFKLNNNPLFMIEAENFFNKKMIVTFDVFVLTLELLIGKIEKFQEFNIEDIKNEITKYKTFQNREYNLNLSALYRIDFDTELFMTTTEDKIIKYKF